MATASRDRSAVRPSAASVAMVTAAAVDTASSMFYDTYETTITNTENKKQKKRKKNTTGDGVNLPAWYAFLGVSRGHTDDGAAGHCHAEIESFGSLSPLHSQSLPSHPLGHPQAPKSASKLRRLRRSRETRAEPKRHRSQTRVRAGRASFEFWPFLISSEAEDSVGFTALRIFFFFFKLLLSFYGE